LVSSHLRSGFVDRNVSTTRFFAPAVESHAAGSHERDATTPFMRSNSMRGCSLGYPFGAVLSASYAWTSRPDFATVATAFSRTLPDGSASPALRRRTSWSGIMWYIPPPANSPSAESWTYPAPIVAAIAVL